MKYLKLFESFEDEETIKKDVADILQELIDRGFMYHYLDSANDDSVFFVTIHARFYSGSKPTQFKWSDISDDVYHLIEYMKSKGYEVDHISSQEPSLRRKLDVYPSLDKCESDSNDIISASIFFK